MSEYKYYKENLSTNYSELYDLIDEGYTVAVFISIFRSDYPLEKQVIQSVLYNKESDDNFMKIGRSLDVYEWDLCDKFKTMKEIFIFECERHNITWIKRFNHE